ncbi:methyltransferase domain-containing protein, partial [Patescibacteria group bacterium]|nr:methyltransferase domain-containing protein [Patescibacteria group bacterium]
MNHQTGSNQLLNEELIMEKSLIGENSKVADFGCGMHGYFVYPIAKKIGKHGFIYAVDVLKNVLENLKKSIEQENIVNAKTIWSDLEVLNGTDISPNSLDVGLLINTLHQSQKRANI